MAFAVAMSLEEPLAPPSTGPQRTCIATGETGAPERMIRFVVGPEGDVVPDLARRLPGRGLWVKAERAAVERAVAKNLFAKAARASVKPASDLAERAERRAGLLVVADEADGDGLGKLKAASRENGLPIARLGDAAALGGIFGREQAVYVAVARDDAGGAFIERIEAGAARWHGYRLNSSLG